MRVGGIGYRKGGIWGWEGLSFDSFRRRLRFEHRFGKGTIAMVIMTALRSISRGAAAMVVPILALFATLAVSEARSLPWAELPHWAAETPLDPSPDDQLPGNFSAVRTAVRQSWWDLAVGVEWPGRMVDENGTEWTGSAGEVWVLVRSGFGEGESLTVSRVVVEMFDGERSECRSCRVEEQWEGLEVNGSVRWWRYDLKVRGVVLFNAWESDSAGLADVALRASGEDVETLGESWGDAVVMRVPMPRAVNGSAWVKAWGRVEWTAERGREVPWVGMERAGVNESRKEKLGLMERGDGRKVEVDERYRPESVQEVDAWSHNCVLLPGGKVRCWGNGARGCLGYGNTNTVGDNEVPSSAGDVDVGGEVVQVSAGHWHTCALLVGGRVRCWGEGAKGQLGNKITNNIGDNEFPSSGKDVVIGEAAQVSTGGSHSCALLVEGRVKCWGYGEYGQLGYGNTNTIGDDEYPHVAGDVNVGGEVVQVSAGTGHTCALLVGGRVRCWGRGEYGQLGYGNMKNIGDDEVPSSAGDVDVGGEVLQVSAGFRHTCALLVGDRVRCWGYGEYGQLGYGNTKNIGDHEIPSSAGDVDVGGEVVQVSAGVSHTCALLVGGRVRCWGQGENGDLGPAVTVNLGDMQSPSSMWPPFSTVVEFFSTYSPLGICLLPFRHPQVVIELLSDDLIFPVLSLSSAGFHHTCALLVGGRVKCWGEGEYGQLGYGNTKNIGDNEIPSSAGDVNVGGEVVQVSAGYGHTCALLVGGRVRCWGYGQKGRLGYGNKNNIGDDEVPSSAGDVNVGGEVVKVSAGNGHTCALLVGGRVRCWGHGRIGRLGYGNQNDIGDDEVPSSAGDVNVGGEVLQVSAGYDHTCALLVRGRVRCWGNGEYGRLGYGNKDTIGDDEVPSSAGDVDVGGEVVQVSAGNGHTCALLVGGRVRCWGWGVFGQLGYGNTNNIGDHEVPSSAGDVDVGGEVVQVSAGDYHTCALLVGGRMKCWGRGEYGQLGYGNTNNIGDDEVPSSAGDVDVGGEVLQVSAGFRYTCALLVRRGVRCWGYGVFGQLGYGNTNNIGDDELPSSTPVISFIQISSQSIVVDRSGLQIVDPFSNPIITIPSSYLIGHEVDLFEILTFSNPLPPFPGARKLSVEIDFSRSRRRCPFDEVEDISGWSLCTIRPPNGSAAAAGLFEPSVIASTTEFSPVPATGGSLVIEGFLFFVAASGGFESILVGGKPCSNLIFSATLTSVSCNAPPGIGANISVTFNPREPSTFSLPQSTIFMSYLKPSITSINPPFSIPALGSTSLSISGSNFGPPSVHYPGSALVTIDSTPCSHVTILSDSLLKCTAPSGVGKERVVVVTIANQTSNSLTVSTSPASITSITPSYALLNTTTIISITGVNLAILPTDVSSIFLDGVGCIDPEIVSSTTSLTCTLDTTGLTKWPDARAANITIASQPSSTRFDLFTGIPIPSISTLSAPSYPTSGGTTVRILGDGFGRLVNDVFVEVGGFVVEHDWESEVELRVSLPAGAGSALLRVCSRSNLCSPPSTLSYATPSLSSSPTPYLLTGTTYTNILLCGTNLGPPSTPTSVSIGGIPCTSSSAINTSCARCNSLPATSPFPTPNLVSIASAGTTASFPSIIRTSNPPSITSLSQFLVTVGDSVIIRGKGFGEVDGDVRVLLGSGGCEEVEFLSPDTVITCTVPLDHPDISGSSNTTYLNFIIENRFGVQSSPVEVGVKGKAIAPGPRLQAVGIWGWREAGGFERLHVAWLYPDTADPQDYATAFIITATTLSTSSSSSSSSSIEVTAEGADGRELLTRSAISSYKRFTASIPVSLHTPYNISITPVNREQGVGVEAFGERMVVESCTAGEFLFTSPTPSLTTCLPCPLGARCDNYANTSTLFRLPGIFRLDDRWLPNGLGFTHCPQPLACPGDISSLPVATGERFALTFSTPRHWNHSLSLSIPTPSTSQCREGHEGLLCARCELGYFTDPAGLCRKCPSQDLIAFGIVGLVLVTMLVVGGFLAKTLSKDISDGKKTTTALKILYHHVQRLAIIGTVVMLQWPQGLRDFFTGADSVSMFGTGGLAFIECAMGKDANNLILKTSLTALLLPTCLIIFSAFFWWAWPHVCAPLARRCLNRQGELWLSASDTSRSTGPSVVREREEGEVRVAMSDRYEEWRNWRTRFQVSALVIATLIHATLVRSSLLTVACFPVQPLSTPSPLKPPPPSSRLVSDPSISCSSPTYSSLLALGTVTLILGGLGIPLILLIATYSNRHKLRNPSFRKKWGFAVDAYRESAYLWEGVVLVVKMGLVVGVVLLMQEGAVAQLSAGIVVEVVALMLHAWFKPYKAEVMNQLDNAGHMTTAFTLALCMNLISQSSDGGVGLVSVLVIGVNVAYFLLALALASDRIRRPLENVIAWLRPKGKRKTKGIGEVVDTPNPLQSPKITLSDPIPTPTQPFPRHSGARRSSLSSRRSSLASQVRRSSIASNSRRKSIGTSASPSSRTGRSGSQFGEINPLLRSRQAGK